MVVAFFSNPGKGVKDALFAYPQRQRCDVKQSSPVSSAIPDKVYFRIGEVSQFVGVDTHVLRYWEAEFALIKPFRGKSKQRLYRRQDVENLIQIRELLHNQGFTINGARNQLKALGKLKPNAKSPVVAKALESCGHDGSLLPEIKIELRAIVALLSATKPAGIDE